MSIVAWSEVNKASTISIENNGRTVKNTTANNIYSPAHVNSVITGKKYFELKVISASNISNFSVGVCVEDASLSLTTSFGSAKKYTSYRANGTIWKDGVEVSNALLAYAVGDVIGIGVNTLTNMVSFYKNGIFVAEVAYYFEVGKGIVGVSMPINNFVGEGYFDEKDMNSPIPSGFKAYNYSVMNKSFILSKGEHRKYSEETPSVSAKYSASTKIPVMTSNTTPSGTAFSSATTGAGYDAWKAMDGSISDQGFTVIGATGHIGYKFPTSIEIGMYSIIGFHNSDYSMRDWTFEGSNNEIDWVVLDTRKDILFSGATESFFEASATGMFRSYRIMFTKNNFASQTVIAGLKMFELISKYIPAIPPSWKTVSSTLPTLPQFQSEGMDDLSVFNRKVQTVLESPQAMTSEVLGVGKVFKGTVNLKKYFDLRKLEVK